MRQRRFLVGLMLAAAFGAQASAQEEPATAPPMHDAKTTTPAKFISGPKAEFPDAARTAGEFGKVVVSGVIGPDGHLHDAKVTATSRSALLDASALAAASGATFEPAHDEHGAAIASPADLPYTFSNAKSPGKGGGVLRYRCDQFARDYAWWYKTWPAGQHEDFYLAVLGYAAMAKAQRPDGSTDFLSVANINKEFETRWKAAVETCRASPDRLFIDIFQPEGEALRRLAGS